MALSFNLKNTTARIVSKDFTGTKNLKSAKSAKSTIARTALLKKFAQNV